MAIDPITAVSNVVGKVLDRVLPDKVANDAAKAQLTSTEVQGAIAEIAGQLDVNKAEAASNSMFVAGWRPAVGWICGLGLGVDVIVRPLVSFTSAALGHPINLPALDMSTLLPLLLGMLGLGAMRSFDKTQGTSNGH